MMNLVLVRATLRLLLPAWLCLASHSPDQIPLGEKPPSHPSRDVSEELFHELEELSRLVDVSYCVGTTGIHEPFTCLSRCQDFKGFELVTTWNTGPFLSDSCGYIALSHSPAPSRVIVAFRGTYSIANTIIDLSTIPQEYTPYPGEDDDGNDPDSSKCANCTVHLGFMTSWRVTRSYVLPHLEKIVQNYPSYQLTLVGHSLGGAIAALGALEFQKRGWGPQVTTFGEPRIGNLELMRHIDQAFPADEQTKIADTYRRITHKDDPIPLLPLSEWGYRMHGGEIHISKPDLPPAREDLKHCFGDEDPECIAGAEGLEVEPESDEVQQHLGTKSLRDWLANSGSLLPIPPRFRIWQLFFAHRDYFWRLGLCVPGGDPKGWIRGDSDLPQEEL